MLTTTGKGATIMMHEIAKLRAAVPYGVVPFFQPIIGLREEALSYEALGRLVVDDEILHPGQFMSQLEELSLMVEFDREVTAKSIALVARWNAHRATPIHLHVNVGKENLSDPGYVHFLREMLMAHQFEPHHLTVEVVETCVFYEHPNQCDTLRGIRELGVKLAIDDFPCWDDAATLMRFLERKAVDFTMLKLDRSAVTALCGDESQTFDRTVVMEYLRRARALNLTIVAEGIEDLTAVPLLEQLEIDAIQGFAIGRPAPAAMVYHRHGSGELISPGIGKSPHDLPSPSLSH